MGSANKPPFYRNFLEASEDKATKSAILLDLPKHTLNVGLALAVSCLSFFTLQSFTSLLFLFVIDGISLHGMSILGSCAGRTERTPFAFVALVVLDDRSIPRFCGLLRSSYTDQFFPFAQIQTSSSFLYVQFCGWCGFFLTLRVFSFSYVLYLINAEMFFSSSFT